MGSAPCEISLRLVSRLGVLTLEWSCLLSSDPDTAGSSLPGLYTKVSCWYLAVMKSLLTGWSGSCAEGFRWCCLDPLDDVTEGLSNEYSQMLLAPHE